MKRKDLQRHLEKYGCLLHREGGNHTIFINPKNQKCSTLPRHNEINDYLAKKICKDLGIKKP